MYVCVWEARGKGGGWEGRGREGKGCARAQACASAHAAACMLMPPLQRMCCYGTLLQGIPSGQVLLRRAAAQARQGKTLVLHYHSGPYAGPVYTRQMIRVCTRYQLYMTPCSSVHTRIT